MIGTGILPWIQTGTSTSTLGAYSAPALRCRLTLTGIGNGISTLGVDSEPASKLRGTGIDSIGAD